MPTSPLQHRSNDSTPLSAVPDSVWEFLRRELDEAVFDSFGAEARAGFTDALVACAFARRAGYSVRTLPVAVVVESDEGGPAMTLGAVDAESLATIEASRLAVRAPGGGIGRAREAVGRMDWGGFLHAQRLRQFPVFPDGASRHLVAASRDAVFDPGFGARLRWRLPGIAAMPAVPRLVQPIGLSRGRWVVAHLDRAAPGHACFWLTTGSRAVRRGDPAADHRRVDRAAHTLAERWQSAGQRPHRPLVAVLAALGGELRALVAAQG